MRKATLIVVLLFVVALWSYLASQAVGGMSETTAQPTWNWNNHAIVLVPEEAL